MVTMSRIHSFPPLARTDARLLILGSMPGEVSLAAGQYYAHPRNAFWPIMGHLFGFDPQADYAKRVAALLEARVAVWDVLHSCRRSGSLDSRIRDDAVNDFTTFFADHPTISRLFFNGQKAEASYRRHVLPHLPRQLDYQRLPSTSPAHATLSFEAKLAAWRTAITRS